MSAEPATGNRNKARTIASWGVHFFTAMGVVVALLAIDAMIAGDLAEALLWLGLALIIDGLDGPMARKVDVFTHAPKFDGAILDLVIDYLTYTAVPALLVYQFALVPAGWEIPAAAFMMTTALYCFGNKDMKTSDNYFEGFPATWNLVVLSFFILGTDPWTNLAAIAGLGIMTFVPLKFVHPIRVERLRIITMFVTVCWMLASLWLLLVPGERPYLDSQPAAFGIWLFTSLYIIGISTVRSLESVRGN